MIAFAKPPARPTDDSSNSSCCCEPEPVCPSCCGVWSAPSNYTVTITGFPPGPLDMLNAGVLIPQAKETGQVAATITKENIEKMWSRIRK